MDVLVLADHQELASALYGNCKYKEDLPGPMDDMDGWREKESQGTPYCQCDLMMMIYIYIFFHLIMSVP